MFISRLGGKVPAWHQGRGAIAAAVRSEAGIVVVRSINYTGNGNCDTDSLERTRASDFVMESVSHGAAMPW